MAILFVVIFEGFGFILEWFVTILEGFGFILEWFATILERFVHHGVVWDNIGVNWVHLGMALK